MRSPKEVRWASGLADAQALVDLARDSAKRLLLFDMEAAAERNGSLISSVLLGALCGSGVLPFRKAAFQAAIRSSGLAVEANLRAFEDANQITQRGESTFTAPPQGRRCRRCPRRHARLPCRGSLTASGACRRAVQGVALEGTRRMIDYQDPHYAALYLGRLEKVAALEDDQSPGPARWWRAWRGGWHCG